MIKRREILGVAAVSAFLGAVVGLFLFGQLGGQITPGPAVTAAPVGAQIQTADYPLGGDPGTPLTTTTFSNVADKVMPSIVVITSRKTVHPASAETMPWGNDPFLRRFFGNPFSDGEGDQEVRGLGSGVIVSADGYILTNNHVVNEADKVQVRFDRHRTVDAEVVGTDPQSDLAVLKVNARDLPAVQLGDSDRVKVGEWVVAIGAPFGLDRSVTTGIVSAKGRSNVGVTGANGYEDFIQTDAAINHGNSGGALVNLKGELIGINTAIATQTGGSNGVGFSIPINMARYVMKSLIDDGKVTRGWMGVNIQEVTETIAKGLGLDEARGVIISGVQDGSPAARAGLQSNDVILKLNDQVIEDVPDVRNRVATTAPGTTITLQILRDGKTRSIDVKLDELPGNLAGNNAGEREEPSENGEESGDTDSKLGLELRALTPDLAKELGVKEKRGVVVTTVAPNSPGARAGLRAEDVVLEVNREPVASVNQMKAAVKRAGDDLVMRVLRGDNYLFIVFE